MGLSGRVAVVTGASRGIGRQVASGLSAEGCAVLLCARQPEPLEAAVAELAAGGARVASMAVDVAAPGAAAAIVRRCEDELGPVDVLVNNAGGGAPKRMEQLTDADWLDAFELNLFAAARLAAAAVPAMRARRWGRIVNVASVSGREPDPYFAPYSAAKAALINLSKNLSLAYSRDGVLTNCVVPGVTLTELVEANAAAAAAATGGSPGDVMARMLEKHPVAAGRFGDPAEVAAAIVFLASQQAAWITGATLVVDGGTLRSAP